MTPLNDTKSGTVISFVTASIAAAILSSLSLLLRFLNDNDSDDSDDFNDGGHVPTDESQNVDDSDGESQCVKRGHSCFHPRSQKCNNGKITESCDGHDNLKCCENGKVEGNPTPGDRVQNYGNYCGQFNGLGDSDGKVNGPMSKAEFEMCRKTGQVGQQEVAPSAPH